MAKDKWRLLQTTIVSPEEYDIEKQMADTVKLANKEMEAFVPVDVGKLIGLYQAWKQLKGI